VTDNGVAYALDADRRNRVGTESPSPAPGSFPFADGRIYTTSEDGMTAVFNAGATFELLAENPLNDYTLSSWRFAGPDLHSHGKHLFAIGARKVS
jgi:hypothetical protein